ncbi:hypothetical protein FIBSPDRAFT_946821 [Athelia psychrophila]|uniref:Uncharacterized protein n=1 Tax=Athelia psychrophila TaxID=1759441 RepID=A0A166SKW5_9AGAM|nr:hypothetical protein FIBSPDRAFT_946821 [Fibularhizoctonia sp. CBS 109695]
MLASGITSRVALNPTIIPNIETSGTQLVESIENDRDLLDILQNVLSRGVEVEVNMANPLEHVEDTEGSNVTAGPSTAPQYISEPVFSGTAKALGKQNARKVVDIIVKQALPGLTEISTAQNAVAALKAGCPQHKHKHKQDVDPNVIDEDAGEGPPRKKGAVGSVSRLANEVDLHKLLVK